MELLCWKNFSKKNNSTKQPSGAATVEKNIVIKEGASILNPVITLKTSELGYNYMKLNNRYYWVTDVKMLHNGLIEYSLKVDVLASWKSNILSSRQYVLRSASAYDGEIIDTMYPTKYNSYINNKFGAKKLNGDNFNWNLTAGREFEQCTYSIGIINSALTGLGSVTYYLCSASTLRWLCNYLMGNIDWAGVSEEEISQALLKTAFDPFKFIVSCVALPVKFSDIDSTTFPLVQTQLEFGWWTITLPAGKNFRVASTELTIGKVLKFDLTSINHPYNDRGNYVYGNRYTKYDLEFQPFGFISLNADYIQTCSDVRCTITIDITSGMSRLEVNAVDARSGVVGLTYKLTEMTANMGYNIQLSSITAGLGESIARIAGGASMGDASYAESGAQTFTMASTALSIGAGIVTGALGIGSSKSGSSADVKSISGGGNCATFANIPVLYVAYSAIVDDDNTDNGRPLCADRTLSTLSGYTVCAHGDISIPCTNGELESISNFLTSGFFIE